MVKKEKTKSQKLRDVIFLLWKKDSKGFATGEEYYQDLMTKIIDHYKAKL